jgi:hypothetical protein
MTTQTSSIQQSSVALATTGPRPTARPAQPFNAVLQQSANLAISGAEAAAQRLPGGTLLAAAIRDPGVAGGPLTTASPTGLGLPSAGAQPLASPTATSAPGGIEHMMQYQADNAMQYLVLQQQIQDENRAYTTTSNVLKARHDTVKNAIGNIR